MGHGRKFGIAGLGVAAALGLSSGASAITVTQELDAPDLATALFAGGGVGIAPGSISATVMNHSTSTAASTGTYTNPSGTYGIGAGIILSSGNVSDYGDGPNTTGGTTTDFGTPATVAQEALLDPITGGPFSHGDVTQLDITFDMEAGFDTVFFNVTFGSEEFPEFVGSSFIDGFGLYVNGTNIASVGGSPVNINHPDMVAAPGTELDGVLGGSTGAFGPLVHTFSATVGDGSTGNTLTFIVADTSDRILDTTVYISQLGGSAPPPTPPSNNNAVPEPVTAALGVMGLGALGAATRRRR